MALLQPLILALIFFLQACHCNISFDRVQPSCDPERTDWDGCLRGQVCSRHGVCYPSVAQTGHSANTSTKRDLSITGQCGPENGNLTCDPDSQWYFGMCCSEYGWCGNTAVYCGDGCISNCTSIETSQDITALSSNTSATSSRIAIGEPTLANLSEIFTASSTNFATKPVTTDGTCGLRHQGTVCGDWEKGSCCSMYGWCGNTTAHCGDGCQSGPCANGSSISAPSASLALAHPNPGFFKVVGQSGVPAMHAVLMPNGKVIFIDKVEDWTQLVLPNGYYAYSAEYDPVTNQVVPLSYKTNAFCSAGVFLANGVLLNIGGNAPLTAVDPTVGDGFTALRYLRRSATNSDFDGQSWSEPGNKLNTARWYASAQIMPDGTIFVISGSLNGLNPSNPANNNPTYEILDSHGFTRGKSIAISILVVNQPYYMYPFVHLLCDGTMFIFVAKSAARFDVGSSTTVQTYNDLPGDYRTYPNTGGSVLLPLSSKNNWKPDIIICGGGAFQDLTSPTDASCGRIQPLSGNPTWEMDSMPEGRTMLEGTLLPDGTIVWLNGASQGAQGFGLADQPARDVLIYDWRLPIGLRFSIGTRSDIARLYHSVTVLLLDGTILIAGSNPCEQPVLIGNLKNPYVTDFRVEIYTPPYLTDGKADRRPVNITLSSKDLTADGSTFAVSFVVPPGASNSSVVLYHGGFVTHSLHMGQRMAILDTSGWGEGATQQSLKVTMPPNRNVTPPGPYVVYVLSDGIPGIGQFVSVS